MKRKNKRPIIINLPGTSGTDAKPEAGTRFVQSKKQKNGTGSVIHHVYERDAAGNKTLLTKTGSWDKANALLTNPAHVVTADAFTSSIISVTDEGRVYAADVFEVSTSLISQRQVTPEGFMKMPATLARTGTQQYYARELKLDRAPHNLPSNKVITLYRPPSEVFDADSMKSFENQTVAIDHPNDPVTAANWKQHAVGEVRDIKRVGDTMVSLLVVKDQAGIKALREDGKKYLSNGYDFNLDMTPGVTPTGDSYDGVQRNIRGNHVALVKNPRGGPACKVADQGEHQLMKVIIVDGIPVNVDDTGIAVLEKFVAGHAALVGKLAATVKVGDTTLKVDDVASLQTVIDGLVKNQVTPEQLVARVNARVKLIGDATKLIPAYSVDGKTDTSIQREVIAQVIAKDETAKKTVEAILGATGLDKAEESALGMAFNVLVATTVASDGTHQAADAGLHLAAALTGTKTSSAVQVVDENKLVGRAAMIARQNAYHESKK